MSLNYPNTVKLDWYSSHEAATCINMHSKVFTDLNAAFSALGIDCYLLEKMHADTESAETIIELIKNHIDANSKTHKAVELTKNEADIYLASDVLYCAYC